MNKYVVAIPTYKRHVEIETKTLATLKTGKVNSSKVYIFVANKDEQKIYMNALPKSLYNKIIVGKLGIRNQRKFISTYFDKNQYIISMDDDVEEVLELNTSTDKLDKMHDLNKFFTDSYKLLMKEKLFIWGIYPVKNPFFMKKTVTTNLRFIIGVMFGYINRHCNKLYPSPQSESKEDYEQSILYYKKDGGVLRYNYITPKTKFNAPGGLGTDRYAKNKTAADYLIKTYPDIVTGFSRDNGTPEVKFNKMPRILDKVSTRKKTLKNNGNKRGNNKSMKKQ